MPKSRKVLLLALALGAMLALSWSDVAAAKSHGGDRQLTATAVRLHKLQRQEWKSKSVINFWNNRGRWALHLRHDKCWQVTGNKRSQVCKMARQSLRFHKYRLPRIEAAIEKLTAPKLDVGNVSHWLCIHRGEGAWNANTGNGYYGGLQMDWSFMSSYGPKVLGYSSDKAMFAQHGTADRWSPKEQMAVAEYARASGRGYYPWPNTARDCGLI